MPRTWSLPSHGFGVECDEQFFVGGNNHSGGGAILGDDVAGFLAALHVAIVIDFVAEELEVFHDGLTDQEAVFTNAAGEDESVDAGEGHGDAADFAGQLVAEGFNSDLCANVAFACSLAQGAHVVGKAGETEKTRFLVHHLVETVDIVAVLLADEEEDCRVDGTGTGTHDETIQRGEKQKGDFFGKREYRFAENY